MIQASNLHFPNNIVNVLYPKLDALDADLRTFMRPLRATDPVQAVGVYASDWNPDRNSHEIGSTFPGMPTLSTYTVTIQALIKDMDRERGLNVHALLSRMVRSMLYTDTTLRVTLSGLTSTLNGATERSQRWGVSRQKFLANQLGAEWLYLSTLEFWLETETR